MDARKNFSFYLSCDVDLQVCAFGNGRACGCWLGADQAILGTSRRLGRYRRMGCDAPSQVKVRVAALLGRLPSQDGIPGDDVLHEDQDQQPQRALHVVAQLVAGDEALGLEARTRHAEPGPGGCRWGEWLTFCLKVRLVPRGPEACGAHPSPSQLLQPVGLAARPVWQQFLALSAPPIPGSCGCPITCCRPCPPPSEHKSLPPRAVP